MIISLLIVAVVILSLIVIVTIQDSTNYTAFCSIYDFCVNDNLDPINRLLKRKIERNLPENISLIIIQDDIRFFDSKFYWPKKHAFIHLSDMNNLSKKYVHELSTKKYSKEFLEEFKLLLNYRVNIL